MKQRGTILPLCLLFLSLISMLTLTLMTHNHWQQKLGILFITHAQNQTAVYFAVSHFFKQKKDFNKDFCSLDWQNSETVWQNLLTDNNDCLAQEGKITIRYITLLSQSTKEALSIAVLAKTITQTEWQKFLIYLPGTLKKMHE